MPGENTLAFGGPACRADGAVMGEQDDARTRSGTPSRSTIPPTNAFRASGCCPTATWCTVGDLLTADELKTSPTHNEMLLRTGGQDSLNARLDGPDGSSIT